jgi:hypothetical protein
MAEPGYNTDSEFYRVKKGLDKLLPVMLVSVVLYLYLDLLASSSHLLYGYKALLQYSILAYFVADLLLLFMMYEENGEFFRNHWFDILLTVPFLTAFKGLKGMKIIKMSRGGKLLKPGKALKGVKVGQKTGKLVKKGRKLVKKFS